MKSQKNKIINEFIVAAEKQSIALTKGGFGHAIWCNYSHSNVGSCNCGISDLQKALNNYKIAINKQKME